MGSFTNLIICIYVLKIQMIKLAQSLETDCFLTCNNHFCFSCNENREINVRLGVWFLLLYIKLVDSRILNDMIADARL